jgi:hypothetical protein
VRLTLAGRGWPGRPPVRSRSRRYHPAVGLGRATLAFCPVLCLVPVPAAARSGPSDGHGRGTGTGPGVDPPSPPSGPGLPCTADRVVRLDQPIFAGEDR